ncbi:YcgL domain-containing protein [Succinatimonas hippei]|uniref:YcgL domain-containing protein n=1 Tax=Succinatimonas hippei TaxID=626938 RepID=UPI0020120F41|nr:YcgL domain-containing protein [Succinatimonas hippei]MCL1603395.1 YcgL domain-containing protein [Succinatimonas hippei]MDM8121029.1 YcgL domain-containing protein [Succinatimonas hippei]
MGDQLVFVYKSLKKNNMFLYLARKDAFADVPSGLLDAFGAPKFVLMFALSKKRTLVKVTHEELSKALTEKGYFLRIDIEDEEENLLNQERKRLGLPPLEKFPMK